MFSVVASDLRRGIDYRRVDLAIVLNLGHAALDLIDGDRGEIVK